MLSAMEQGQLTSRLLNCLHKNHLTNVCNPYKYQTKSHSVCYNLPIWDVKLI